MSSRQVIRSQLLKCIRCFRARPVNQPPLMGNLPTPRVTPSPPFFNSGMDYAGPFTVKLHNLRKSPIVKAYLCIFVCFSSKAIHLEISQDLSTNSFLDVLQRFISRRSAPHNLYSDCGTNFVGAARVLNQQWKQLISDNSSDILNFCSFHQIHFHFVGPAAPHKNGLCERAVRSTKHHLYRILGNHTPTMFQLSSLFTRIEAILNSRPLVPMSSDPHDFSVLTPAHFLVGRPMVSPPEPDFVSTPINSLSHFHLVQGLTQHFWKRWRVEYLPALQARAKWFRSTPNLELGDLVIIEDPNSSPLCWPIGRISAVFPNTDHVVRKAEVTTATGKYSRPASRIFRLPLLD